MAILRLSLALFAIAVTSGCANMSPPKHIAAIQCEDNGRSSLCLLDRLQLEYEAYGEGARKGQRTTDGIMLASASVGVVGAALGSGSDLYKSAGGIGLSALGFSNYGNFKFQQEIVDNANSRLSEARTRLTVLLDAASEKNSFIENKNLKTLVGFSDNTSTQEMSKFRVHLTENSTDALDTLRNTIKIKQNAKTADTILKDINKDATSLILKLQKIVTAQINEKSFDIESAIAVINTKPKLETKAPEIESYTLSSNNNLTPEEIIDLYNEFLMYMAGKKDTSQP